MKIFQHENFYYESLFIRKFLDYLHRNDTWDVTRLLWVNLQTLFMAVDSWLFLV